MGEDEKQEWSMAMVGWLLWNLVLIREMHAKMEPQITAKYIDIPLTVKQSGTCKVVKVAIERAAVSAVLNAVDKAIGSLHPEQRKIYRMKYRARLTRKDIEKKTSLSARTIDRRVAEVKEVIARELSMVPEDLRKDFWRKIDALQ